MEIRDAKCKNKGVRKEIGKQEIKARVNKTKEERRRGVRKAVLRNREPTQEKKEEIGGGRKGLKMGGRGVLRA